MTAVLDVFTVAPFGENTYLFGDSDAGEAIVIDPGGRVGDILRVAELRGVKIVGIVNTHAHIDHVLGVAELKLATGAPFRLHREAAATLPDLPAEARRFDLSVAAAPSVDGDLDEGDTISVGQFDLEVRYTPGHAPGHVTLFTPEVLLDGQIYPVAFCGDVIFFGSIGRTDLAGGSYEVLMTSIEDKILTLPDDTVLYSGHGPATTVARERAQNPFVREWRATTGQHL